MAQTTFHECHLLNKKLLSSLNYPHFYAYPNLGQTSCNLVLIIWYLSIRTTASQHFMNVIKQKITISSYNELNFKKMQHAILLVVCYMVAIYIFYWHGRVVLSVKGSSATSKDFSFQIKTFNWPGSNSKLNCSLW